MLHSGAKETNRRATNVTLPADLVAEAKALDVNLSQACEAGLVLYVTRARRARWLEENQEAIDAYNERVEQDGLILEDYRRF
ncbi:type II toxin-antitoxin system CcdA family antitoxin [Microvirga massiliensis]|uniref:type II toxin-antitoxin system CcdA family antitoxin n=1 Tax=Microvirga massiliensis TaxID=1033741 RepID=UPI00062BB31C|nr:type II toxin-antitoxin system CcdA family antitoxin [Microvirga massiliensis]